MRFFLLILLSLLLGDQDSSKNILKTNFFDDVKFKEIDKKVSDLIPKEHLNRLKGTSKYIISEQIDSIKLVANNYIPTAVSDKDTIIIETTKGTIKFQYFPQIAPKHCYNFKKLANSGYYDKTKFHRIMKGFMIQGGDILTRDSSKDNDGYGGPGWTVEAEFNNISHISGVLSMARGPEPNSAGSQFFICHGNPSHLNNKYTAFGKVIEGMHVVDLIANTPTDYTTTILKSFNQIPSDEDPIKWIESNNPRDGKTIFFKIPNGEDRYEYQRKINKNLRSNQPTSSIVIKRIRVLDYKSIIHIEGE